MYDLISFIIMGIGASLVRAWLSDFGKAFTHNILFHLLFGVVGVMFVWVVNPALIASPFAAVLFGYGVPAFFESFLSIFRRFKWQS